MAYKLNPFTGKFDKSNDIPLRNADPSSPAVGQSWVVGTGGADTGSPLGLLLSLTSPVDVSAGPYQFSYRTAEGTTVRATLT